MSRPALAPNAAPQKSRMRTPCPHCGSPARIRSSRSVTPIYSEVRFECSNEGCGHVWLASLGVLHTLYPSASPNPEVHIPFAAGRESAPAKTAAG